ncbi:MFS transporter [Paenibacillus enshidis]|uniref:MFS transporter n=1 Tax=Paenibacillus enshidis TaxID=1458439 RepID=A0ABV5AQG1_9BACL
MSRFGIYVLTIGAFLAVTAELMLIGVTDLVARDLQVPLSFIGHLVTAYALAFAVGTPIVITLTARLERKRVMLAALFFFVLANLVSSWSPNFAVLMVARALLGLSGGVFVVVAMGAVSKLVPPDKVGGAIGTIMMGLSGSLVFGVPLGIVLSGWFSWQFAFGVIAVLGVLIWIGILLMIPAVSGGESVPLRRQFSVFMNKKMVSGFLITLFVNAGSQTVYTFLTPVLQTTTQMNTWMISLTMLVLGIFSMIGSRLGGFGADRFGVKKTVYLSLIIHATVLLLLPVFMFSIATFVLALSVWICFTWMASPALQTYFVQQSPQNPDLALSLNTSFTQLGIALGASLGGWVVNLTGDLMHTTWAGGLIVLLAIAVSRISFVTPDGLGKGSI